MKKAIYTFIIDSHDPLKEPAIQNPDWDHICVTDNPNLKSNTWKILQVNEEHSKIECPKRKAMTIMIDNRSYLSEDYDVVVSIGGQMTINCNLDQFLKNVGFEYPTTDFAINKHRMRQCVYLEAQAIVDVKKDSIANIQEHVNQYLAEGYPKNNGLFATGIMILNYKSEKTKKYFDVWKDEYINRPSRRDQMSCNFALWRTEKELKESLNLVQMDEANMYWGDKYFLLHNHTRPQIF